MNKLWLSSTALLLLATACQDRDVSAPVFRGRTTRNAVVFPPGSIPPTFAAAINIDKVNKQITLPLFRGVTVGGGATYFILTESSDFGEAVRLGINWSPKLTNALGTAAVQSARLSGGLPGGRLDGEQRNSNVVHFSGTVDFSPTHVLVPGQAPNYFPPATAQPGSVGDPSYSPLFTFGDGIVYNGAQVANRTGLHDKVVSIDYDAMQVTFRMTAGFYTGHNVLYISTDASDPGVAAIERATFAPNLADAPQAGNDDPATSAREPIIPIVNGPLGVDNPERQGLNSAVAGQGDPLNIIREEPECSNPNVPAVCSALQYSPLWDVHPVVWTQAAIDQGVRRRVTDHQVVEALFNQGWLVNANPAGPENHDPEIDGLRALGVVVNCPPMVVEP